MVIMLLCRQLFHFFPKHSSPLSIFCSNPVYSAEKKPLHQSSKMKLIHQSRHPLLPSVSPPYSSLSSFLTSGPRTFLIIPLIFFCCSGWQGWNASGKSSSSSLSTIHTMKSTRKMAITSTAPSNSNIQRVYYNQPTLPSPPSIFTN